jgi:OmcA/MtrC family decaheme c-type cytochrome
MRAAAQPNPDGTWTYQFPPRAATDPWLPGGPVIPPDARGTFAVGLEGRRAVALAPGVSFEEADDNPVAYFSVDGSAPAGYTNLVDIARCDRCHGELRAHGNLRRNPEYCVLCHAADATDWAQRPKGADGNTNVAATIDQIEERSIRLPLLIHRIHTGDELAQTVPFVVYGFGGSANRFDDVRFPGNRADCTTCHLPSSSLIESIPVSAPPTTANETASVLHQGTPVHPATEPSTPVIQSTCLSCHDSPAAQAHATLETTGTGLEACQVCHGEQRDISVRSVHLAN